MSAKAKKPVRKINIERDAKAIKRNRRNKLIGKILAAVCVVVFVGTVAGIFGGSYKAAEKLWWNSVGQEAGVEFKELFSIFNGVSKADESKIVTNSYSSADLDSFYSNVKRKLYLAEDYELNISKLLGSILGGEKENADNAGKDTLVSVVGTDGYDLTYLYAYPDGRVIASDTPVDKGELPDGAEDQTPSESTGSGALDEFLKEIKFDFSSLENYQGEQNILEITDRQIASVIDEAFGSLSDFLPEIKELETSLGKKLSEVVEIKQIIIKGDALQPQDVRFTLTLGIRLKDLLTNSIARSGLPSFIINLLPVNIYATASVYPLDAQRSAEISLNKMSEVNVDKIARIADVILKKSGSQTSIKSLLTDVNKKVVDIIGKAQEKIPVNFVNTGVDVYPIESMMNTLGVEISEQAFLYMLRDIKLPTEQTLGFDVYTQEIKDRETQEFIGELKTKYCLDPEQVVISAQSTIQDILDFAEDEGAINKVLLKDMHFGGAYNANDYKVRTSYQALSNMLNSYVNGKDMLGDIDADIVNMSFSPKGAILSVDIKVHVANMLAIDSQDPMYGLITQLVPQNIFITANLCVDAELNTPTTIEINKIGAENSRAHLLTLTSLAQKFNMDVSSLGYDVICEKVEKGLRDGLTSMEQQIGCTVEFAADCAYLPNIFEVVSGTGLLDENEQSKISPAGLYTILKQAYTYEHSAESYNKTSADGFISQLESKYYLQKDTVKDDGDGKLMDSVMALKDCYGSVIDKAALAADSRALTQLEPIMKSGEFAYLLAMNVALDGVSEYMRQAEIVGAKIDDKSMQIYLSAKLYGNGETASGENDDLSKYSNLLPETVYATLSIDVAALTDDSANKCVSLVFNGMDEKSMLDFFSIIRKLTSKAADKAQIEDEAEIKIREYIGQIDGIEYTFDKEGLRIDSLFAVIAKDSMVNGDLQDGDHVFTADEIRGLLKKMYGYRFDAQAEYAPSENLDGFISELYDKFFISDNFKNQLLLSQADNTLLDVFKSIGGVTFNTDKVRLSDVVTDAGIVPGLTSKDNVTPRGGKDDETLRDEIISKFLPYFTSGEIAYLLNTQINVVEDMSFLKDMKVVSSYNDDNQLIITMRGAGAIEDAQANALLPDNLFVNLNIELGNINPDGTRSDMNVYSMDINSIAYSEDNVGGELQELELLLEFVNRIKKNTAVEGAAEEEVQLDGVIVNIEEQLKEFKDKIHNEVYTVTFLPGGGFRINETVYQIALNSVYEGTADAKPDEIDFRNGLCRIHNMPDEFAYSDSLTLDFVNSNRAADTQRAIKDINDKYGLNMSYDSSASPDSRPSLFLDLGETAKSFAKEMDGEKLTEYGRGKTIEELRPQIYQDELLVFLEGSVKISADGYKDAKMHSLFIVEDEIVIVYMANVNSVDVSFTQLLPSSIALIISIDIDKMSNSNDICTRLAINDLSSAEVDAVQSVISKLNQRQHSDSEAGADLNDANKQCSDSIRQTMGDLTGNVDVRFYSGGQDGRGLMTLGSIYEVAADRINDDNSQSEKVSAQDVKSTMEALFDGLDIDGYENPDKKRITYDIDSANEKAVNLLLTPDITARTVRVSGAVGGWNIASMINTDDLLEPLGLSENAQGRDDVLLLKHTALVPTVANGDGTFEKIRAAFGSMSDKEYFLITLNMDMVAAVGEDMSILPKRMDVTLYMDLTDKDITVIYNAMTQEQMNVLSRLVKSNKTGEIGGFNTDKKEQVRDMLMDTSIIDENYFGYSLRITLGDLLNEKGQVFPIAAANALVDKNDGVVLGMGAIIVEAQKTF